MTSWIDQKKKRGVAQQSGKPAFSCHLSPFFFFSYLNTLPVAAGIMARLFPLSVPRSASRLWEGGARRGEARPPFPRRSIISRKVSTLPPYFLHARPRPRRFSQLAQPAPPVTRPRPRRRLPAPSPATTSSFPTHPPPRSSEAANQGLRTSWRARPLPFHLLPLPAALHPPRPADPGARSRAL